MISEQGRIMEITREQIRKGHTLMGWEQMEMSGVTNA